MFKKIFVLNTNLVTFNHILTFEDLIIRRCNHYTNIKKKHIVCQDNMSVKTESI